MCLNLGNTFTSSASLAPKFVPVCSLNVGPGGGAGGNVLLQRLQFPLPCAAAKLRFNSEKLRGV